MYNITTHFIHNSKYVYIPANPLPHATAASPIVCRPMLSSVNKELIQLNSSLAAKYTIAIDVANPNTANAVWYWGGWYVVVVSKTITAAAVDKTNPPTKHSQLDTGKVTEFQLEL